MIVFGISCSVFLFLLTKSMEMNMLILTRRFGEKIMLGDDVTITIFNVENNKVKIGIDAPEDVGVYREEIYHRLNQENNKNCCEENS